MNKYRYKLSASVPAAVLRRIYEALETEEKPFSATVQKIPKEARKGDKTHLVTIENDDRDYRDYFAALLAKCKIQN